MPGMGEVIDGAVQQAPQPLRQENAVSTMARSVVRLGKYRAAG
jgi:hypothetical protein